MMSHVFILWLLQKIGDKFPNVNVITIDYRGFGNSEGTPSEEGLRMDARATWDWLRQRGGNNKTENGTMK